MLSKYIDENNTYIKAILTIGVLVGAVTAIASLLTTIPNIIKPKIKILSVDFDNGFCKLEVNGIPKEVYGDSVVSATGNWGIRFGHSSINPDSANLQYETVELIKNDMVQEVLAKKNIV